MSVLDDLLFREVSRSDERCVMAGISYANDPLSRALVRGLLLLQLAALIAVLAFSLLDLFLPALAISMLTLFIFVAMILWLYLRYRRLPVVCEKRMLDHLVTKFRSRRRADQEAVQVARLERKRLVQAEQNELLNALSTDQQDAIQEKFRALRDQNDALERRAIDSQKILEHELMLLEPRLRQLTQFTFLGYLSRSLASRGVIAVLIAFLLIAIQVLSSVSAMGSAFMTTSP